MMQNKPQGAAEFIERLRNDREFREQVFSLTPDKAGRWT